jgi:cytidylate kinase
MEFRRLSAIEDLKIEDFGSIPDASLRKVDEQIRQRIQNEVNKIWDGRLTCYLAHDNTRIFKIFCIATFGIRVERCANRDNISLEEANRKVEAHDIEESNVFKRLYGFSNPYNERWVDLQLDTSYASPEILVDKVKQILSR